MRSRQERLYHLALARDWETATAGNSGYRSSTLGLDLAEVGFIHCSYADQVRGVADRVYHDHDDVVLLTIDQSRLTSRVREETISEKSDVEYPHIYGPLNLEAVEEVTPLKLRPDGTLDLPDLKPAGAPGAATPAAGAPGAADGPAAAGEPGAAGSGA